MYCDPVMAHRGASAYAPENTLSAYRLAAEQGARWVETDVALLGDGMPIMFHDATFDRCTNGSGDMRTAGYAYARTLDAGSWFSSDFAGEGIPTLAEALSTLQAVDLCLNLELKTHGGEGGELARAVAPILDAGWQSGRRLMVSSFDETALFAMKEIRPEMTLALICDAGDAERRAVAKELGTVSMNLDYRETDEDMVAAIRDMGMEVYLYTPNDPKDVAHMWNWGISGIITDDPPIFLAGDAIQKKMNK